MMISERSLTWSGLVEFSKSGLSLRVGRRFLDLMKPKSIEIRLTLNL